MKKKILTIGCAILIITPCLANAQFGGLLSSVTGNKVNTTGTPQDFINNTTITAKYIWISSEYMNQIISGNKDNAANKAKLDSINNIQNISQLEAKESELKTSTDAAAAKMQDVQNASDAYNKSDAEQKAKMGAAIYNLALGALSATSLSRDATSLISAVKSNPMAYIKDGKDIASAAKVVGVLAEGTGKIMVNLPKLATTAKVQLPTDAKAGKPMAIGI